MIPIDKLKSAVKEITTSGLDGFDPEHLNTLVKLAQSVIDGSIFAGEEEIYQIVDKACQDRIEDRNGDEFIYPTEVFKRFIAQALVGKVKTLDQADELLKAKKSGWDDCMKFYKIGKPQGNIEREELIEAYLSVHCKRCGYIKECKDIYWQERACEAEYKRAEEFATAALTKLGGSR